MANEFAVDGGQTAPSPAEGPMSDAQAETAALKMIAESKPDSFDASDYIEERKDMEAQSRGDDKVERPHRKAARLERYQRAIQATQEKQQAEPQQAQEYSPQNQQPADWENQVREQAKREARFQLKADEYFSQQPSAKAEVEALVALYPISDHVQRALIGSDLGPAILHEVAKNPDAVAELNNLGEAQLAYVIGAVEGRLRAERAYVDNWSPPPDPRRSSRAPAPIKPVTGGASRGIDLNNTSMDAYVKYRRAQSD